MLTFFIVIPNICRGHMKKQQKTKLVFKFDVDEALLKYDRRLRKENQIKIMKFAKKSGFESCYAYMRYLIEKIQMPPRDIVKMIGIKDHVYYGMANKILLFKTDNLALKEEQKLKKKIEGELCIWCNEKPKVGYFYCKDCFKKVTTISDQIDLEMMGDW